MEPSDHKKLSRSTIEAYAGIAIAILAFVLPVTWWLKLILMVGLAGIAWDLSFRSPWTIKLRKWVRSVIWVLALAALTAMSWAPVRSQYDEDRKAKQRSKTAGETSCLTVPAPPPQPKTPAASVSIGATRNGPARPRERARKRAPAASTSGKEDRSTVPEITAEFVQGSTAPGVILTNKSTAVIRDPFCSLSMFDLAKNPPLNLPTVNENSPEQFIKPGSGLILATLDTPATKPVISKGDRLFGLVTVDCPECKSARHYWLYFVWGSPTDSWYSEVPEPMPMNPIFLATKLLHAGYNIDAFLAEVPHGEQKALNLPTAY